MDKSASSKLSFVTVQLGDRKLVTLSGQDAKAKC